MNRKTKGALAAGAGVILLLGGAGSYALWSDEEDVTGGNISTGDFSLNCGSGGTWTDESTDGVIGGTAVNPTTDWLVPGDTWVYGGECTATATGKNMKAQLIANLTGSTPPPTGITVTTQMGTAPAGTPMPIPQGTTSNIPVKVTVVFDRNVTGTTSAGHQQVNVAGMKLRLEQVRP